jgi:hypothetical protein
MKTLAMALDLKTTRKRSNSTRSTIGLFGPMSWMGSAAWVSPG